MPRLRSIKIYLLAFSALTLTLLLLLFPAAAMEASLRGIAIWWEILFPTLLPFIIVSEIMLGFGLVHFMGALFDPIMRPLFRIPGIGGFVMAMGFASGYPVGARLTSQLWEQKLVTREEGERLVAFTTSSDPIFLIGAVSVGFFHSTQLAVILATAHYGGALLVGLMMRFHSKNSTPSPKSASASAASPLILRAFQAMHEARLKDGRTIGQLLRDAVTSSLHMIFVIGGLVVFFSVVMELFRQAYLLQWLEQLAGGFFALLSIPAPLTDSIVNGLFEVTLGAKAAAEASAQTPLMYKAMLAAIVLSWGGLSVHGQIVSLLYRTNIRYTPFLLARVAHSLFAAMLVVVLWKPLTIATEVWLPFSAPNYSFDWLNSLQGNMKAFILLILILLAGSFLAKLLRFKSK
ncbi:sporulation integral membrane protein YlbJ [Paenibacillus senegalensis]|uniref:sporulation integral membrane protein YlbJ n=1 Tax=Paenibacillus senegalensis TaxID=1465766 RepID=UPI0002892BAF|nr:sporulation integral membrane protein YlbJ [Paenibacillus senegalensis]